MKLEARAGKVALAGIRLAVMAAGVPKPLQESSALYLLVTLGNVPGALAGEVAGCSKQNISKLLRGVEDRREDPAYDAQLSALEAGFMGEGF